MCLSPGAAIHSSSFPSNTAHTAPNTNITHLSMDPVFWECYQPRGSTASMGRAQHTAHVEESLQRLSGSCCLLSRLTQSLGLCRDRG